jgi:hypothetical protein
MFSRAGIIHQAKTTKTKDKLKESSGGFFSSLRKTKNNY